jgi:protein ImuB
VFAASWYYEPPVETLEPLQFKLQRHSERLALELRASGLVAESLSLTLHLEDGRDHRRVFRLPEPGTDVDSWQRVLASHLETMPAISARLANVRLVANPTRPEVKQDGLFDTGLKDPQAFWENLARMAAVVGDHEVGTPLAADTYRPDAFSLVRPAETVPAPEPAPLRPLRGYALRRFRPAWSVRVALEKGKPAQLVGELSGVVKNTAGPWRSNGEWWKPGGWDVETWQIELAQGVYQLARDCEGWWVEGILD